MTSGSFLAVSHNNIYLLSYSINDNGVRVIFKYRNDRFKIVIIYSISSSLPSSKPANITTQESKSNSSADYMTGNKVGKIDGSVGIRDAGAACAKLNGTRLNQCIQGYNTGFNSLCATTKFGCNE